MLDHCSIFHKGGIVLWSRSFTPAAASISTSASSPINSLVREALIEGRTTDDSYEKDGYAIKWSFVNDLELIFVVTYQRILQLTYAEDLLAALKTVFLSLYEPFLVTFVASLHGSISLVARDITLSKGITIDPATSTWNFSKIFAGWDKTFDKVLKRIEDKVAQDRKSRLRSVPKATLTQPSPPSSPDDAATTPSKETEPRHDAEDISKNVEVLKSRLKGSNAPVRGGRRRGAKGNKAVTTNKDSPNTTDSQEESPQKAARTWDDTFGPIESTSGDLNLDYSSDKPGDIAKAAPADLSALVDESSRGTIGQDGFYEVKDLDFGGNVGGGIEDDEDEEDDLITRALSGTSFGREQLNRDSSTGETSAATITSRFSALFSRITGGSKVLTKEDLDPVLAGMKDHLMQKNVAQEIATKICEGIGESLVGTRVSGFRGVKAEVRKALSDAITRILTPKTSTDLLLAIRTKLGTSSTSSAAMQRTPYIMAFVGVNGVGKSTNLSKVCFWLLQNQLKVLIAACDTFRSGAVEQLRVHVRNLGLLVRDEDREKGTIELYEKGYGKDAAGIAKEAITYATGRGFDVVLIDTAGRMQDNEPLMKALAKLVSTNNPDKVIFVGEALVGNEAVDQLQKFDSALKNYSAASSGAGKGHGIDGMLVTKWDTVDDKVGAALSMTYVTGQPILFVGCGQTYTDLRQLRVSHIVLALMSD
ncbi:uncharacterized protein EI90DRAFT_3118935 [Cantharellus anzutake]|uniref:uncharacterized protein n=1 Tax=Cantharellus anzutake TaxID=1750568 RepID=UPI001908EB34|nr:uncharacterized protein EI90DRAFT_3118935 [Cantharellus anzutake]KAF8337491.1 hypothetical protein EI90DRAFT_3118935 [Cantharellus anzutake]